MRGVNVVRCVDCHRLDPRLLTEIREIADRELDIEAGIDHLNLVPIDPDPLGQITKLAGVVRSFGHLVGHTS